MIPGEGVTIAKLHYDHFIFHIEGSNTYHINVYSHALDTELEFEDEDINVVINKTNEVLVENFYASLLMIDEHFKYDSDFCNPGNNLINLKAGIADRVSDFLVST